MAGQKMASKRSLPFAASSCDGQQERVNDEVFATSVRKRKERKLNSNAVATFQKHLYRVNGSAFLSALDETKLKVSSVLTTKIDDNNDQEEDHNKKSVQNQHDRSFKPYMDEQKRSATPGKYRHRHVSTNAGLTPASSGPLKKRLKMRYSLENPLFSPFTPSGFYDLTPGPISSTTSTIPSTSKSFTSDIRVQPLRLPFADILSSNTKSAESRISNKQCPMLLKAPVVALTLITSKASPLSASMEAQVNTTKNATNFPLYSADSGSGTACIRNSLSLQVETTKNETSLALSSENVGSVRNGIGLPAYRTRGRFPPVLPVLTHHSLMTKEPTGYLDLPNRDIYICLIRDQLEFFDASPEDVALCKSKGVYAFDGQIGMRCKHCCCIPVAFRRKGSLVFARKLYTLYNYFNNIENNSHLKSCLFVPEATKKEIDQFAKRILLQEVVSLRDGLGYWMRSAKDEGVVETNEGLRFKAPPLQAQLASDLSSPLASNKFALRMLELDFTHQPVGSVDSYPSTQTENQVSDSHQPRLNQNDVKDIFESLRGTRPFPSHLTIQFVSTEGNNVISPPFLEFSEGIYALLTPTKLPPHLSHLQLKQLKAGKVCKWQASGPQIKYVKALSIQSRYVYPIGDPEYSRRTRGIMWTRLGNDGKEEMKYRLFQVYFSQKRSYQSSNNKYNTEKVLQQKQRKVIDVNELLGSKNLKRRMKSSRIITDKASLMPTPTPPNSPEGVWV